jgi:hypothetical protein
MADIKLQCPHHPRESPGMVGSAVVWDGAVGHLAFFNKGARRREQSFSLSAGTSLDRDCTTNVTGAQCFHRVRGDIKDLSQLTVDLPTLEKMGRQASLLFKRPFCCFVVVSTINAEEPCHVETPTAVFSIPYLKIEGRLIPIRSRRSGRKPAQLGSRRIVLASWTILICRQKSEASGPTRTSTFLFTCPYRKLNVFSPAQNDRPRDKLWDRDVVEMFLGDDWKNTRHYREFEIAPTGDWIDLAIDLDHKNYDKRWRSGWQVLARIDEAAHRWFAAARIPLKSVSETLVQPGPRWRMNLYRIEGEGPDSQRHFLCWQPTCVANRDPNHVPEAFGTLVFQK